MATRTRRSSARAAAPKKTTQKRTTRSSSTKTTAKKSPVSRKPHRPAGALVSRSTATAKWVETAIDHEDRPGQSLATRSHEVIRKWAEERGAVPATAASSRQPNRPRVLKFDLPGFGGGKRLQQISWEEWFKTFDERELVFLYQEHLKSGNQSNFFRLESPEREAA